MKFLYYSMIIVGGVAMTIAATLMIGGILFGILGSPDVYYDYETFSVIY